MRSHTIFYSCFFITLIKLCTLWLFKCDGIHFSSDHNGCFLCGFFLNLYFDLATVWSILLAVYGLIFTIRYTNLLRHPRVLLSETQHSPRHPRVLLSGIQSNWLLLSFLWIPVSRSSKPEWRVGRFYLATLRLCSYLALRANGFDEKHRTYPVIPESKTHAESCPNALSGIQSRGNFHYAWIPVFSFLETAMAAGSFFCYRHKKSELQWSSLYETT